MNFSTFLNFLLVVSSIYVCVHVRACTCLVRQSCPTLYDPTVHESFQARILEWVAISSSRGSSWPMDQTHICCISCITWVVCKKISPVFSEMINIWIRSFLPINSFNPQNNLNQCIYFLITPILQMRRPRQKEVKYRKPLVIQIMNRTRATITFLSF